MLPSIFHVKWDQNSKKLKSVKKDLQGLETQLIEIEKNLGVQYTKLFENRSSVSISKINLNLRDFLLMTTFFAVFYF